MAFVVQRDCHCCQEAARKLDVNWELFYSEKLTGKKLLEWNWHDENCWNEWHNGIRDKDWLDKEDYMKRLNNGQCKPKDGR